MSFPVEHKRPPNYTDWMKHRVDSPEGKRKVQGQWLLYCLVHNIEKLANYGQLAA